MHMSDFRVRGVVAAPPPAYKPNGDVATEIVDTQAKMLKESGIVGVYTTGTTGEGLALSVEERKEAITAWAKACKAHGLIHIAHIGHAVVRDAQALARHAAEVGADAFAAVPPFYYRPANIEALVNTMAEIASAAPHLPFYYYHIPSFTNVNFSMYEFFKAVHESGKIPNFRGMKFTDTNLGVLRMAASYQDGRYNILLGGDDIQIAGQVMGADGTIGVCYNVPSVGRLAAQIDAKMKEGDLAAAMELQKKVTTARFILSSFPEGAVKAAIKHSSGVDLGGERPPRRTLTDKEAQDLMAQLGAANLL
eukprot:comp21161_c0_seq1/m.28664 comp21161_c0_seq1/g.28664  ORF comp21161_c0_seq1/g.28664 comp21161_c0_seq1/m.28664 type:complete len:307 (-) comp21161_c0_seq1:426-1346(-)